MLNILLQINDHRRAQGKRYELHLVLLFTILAMLSNAKSYRDISSFMNIHFKLFKKKFKLKWKDPPAYTTIRSIIQGVDPTELERVFRLHAQSLSTGKLIAIDGKTLRGSFDNFIDQKAIHLLSAFSTEDNLILGHLPVTYDKTNEIPKLVELIEELGLEDCLVTADALHCQKKALNASQGRITWQSYK